MWLPRRGDRGNPVTVIVFDAPFVVAAEFEFVVKEEILNLAMRLYRARKIDTQPSIAKAKCVARYVHNASPLK